MIRDIKLMKQFNISTVRTAHYPSNFEFLELLDVRWITFTDNDDEGVDGYR